ncbi:hypothetical protein J4438_01320 [Candidatus Woesearchaeota archaeon]|nr:hypothetical protein [Candidatus Woesearchaeota archaeon]
MKSKKGAIELSMTAIIVIVLGITLLTLGLVWVRGIFENLEGLSGKAFDNANTAISEVGQADKPLTIKPSEINLKPKENNAIGIVVANLENQGPITVTLRANSEDSNLLCGFPKGDKLVSSVGPTTIESGSQISQVLGVVDKSGNIRLTSCDIIIDGLSGDNTDTLVIDIK